MNDEVRSEILRRWHGGQSGREIARDLRLSRKTVAKALAQHQQQRATGTTGLPTPREKRGSLVDPYEVTLREYLARYPDISVVRLLEELRRSGYAGGYTVLRERVRQLRPPNRRVPVERFETGPGVQAQMDYSLYTLDFSQEGRRRVNLFSYVLGYSRRQYLRFTPSQDMETTLREHVLVMVGQSGVGKSHLLQGLSRRYCELGYRVRYTTSADLLEDLRASLADQSLPRRVRYWARFDLVVIDEFGFDRIERGECPQAAHLFYKVIDARSGKRSTALATNIDFEAWSDYLGDPPLAMAFLDRVVDGAILLKIRGKSYRAHRAKKSATNSSADPA